ncbi:MAG: sensor histidine kinase [bacterium]
MAENSRSNLKCWEMLNCRNEDCPAFGREDEACWFLMLTQCQGDELETNLLDKFTERCLNCKVFQEAKDRARGRRSADALLIRTIDEITKTLILSDEKLGWINEVGAALGSTMDLEEVLRIILTGVTSGEALGLNRAFLFLVDRDKNILEGQMAIGPSSEEEAYRIWSQLAQNRLTLREIIERNERLPESNKVVNDIVRRIRVPLTEPGGILVKSILERRTFNIIDARNNPEVDRDLLEIFGVDAFVVVPLISKGKAIGAILADNKFTRRPITNRDIYLLEAFASQASIAIERAELYRDLEEKVRQTEEAYRALQESQNRLIRAERLAAIGEVTAKVAHEIKNPLMSIGGFARLVLKRMGEEDPNIKYLGMIEKEVERLEGLLKDILSFSAPSEPNFQEGDINEVIQEALLLVNGELERSNIGVLLQLAPSLPAVSFDRGQIGQVLLNLFLNAIHAMPEGGELSVSSELAGEHVRITVGDTGVGIPEEHLDKLFVPFFTTKPNGSGLGLSISHQILRNHGGMIDVVSKVGVGTTFTVKLPTRPLTSG